ncbi:hypothetical protein BDF19DRAFT_285167 [Syncephalis fuscata]|nr:hypothetical protein BDF19DRAFT_285167 [Syncephalis fuscata]
MTTIIATTPSITSTRTEKEEAAFRRIIELDARCRDPLPTRRGHAVFSFVDVFDESPTTVILYTGIQKLADLFETTDNTMRFAVVQVLREARRHFAILDNVDQAARRIMAVAEKRTDRLSHRLALLALDCLVNILDSPLDVYHNVVKLLSAPDKSVQRTAIRVASRLYRNSVVFQRIALAEIVSNIEDNNIMDDTTKAQLLRMLGQTRCDLHLAYKTMQLLANYALQSHHSHIFRLMALNGWTALLVHTITRTKHDIVPVWSSLLNDQSVVIRVATLQQIVKLLVNNEGLFTHMDTLYDVLSERAMTPEADMERVLSMISLHLWHKMADPTITQTSTIPPALELGSLPVEQLTVNTRYQLMSILLSISEQLSSLVIMDFAIQFLDRILSLNPCTLSTGQLYKLLKRLTSSNSQLLAAANVYERVFNLTKLKNITVPIRELLLSCLLRLPAVDSTQVVQQCQINLTIFINRVWDDISLYYLKLTLHLSTSGLLSIHDRKHILYQLIDILQRFEDELLLYSTDKQKNIYWIAYNIALLCGQAGLFCRMDRLLTPLLKHLHNPSIYYWIETVHGLSRVLKELNQSMDITALTTNCSTASANLFKLTASLQSLKSYSGQSLSFQFWWLHLYAQCLQAMTSIGHYFNINIDSHHKQNIQPIMSSIRVFDELADQFFGLSRSFPSVKQQSLHDHTLNRGRASCQLISYLLRRYCSIKNLPSRSSQTRSSYNRLV